VKSWQHRVSPRFSPGNMLPIDSTQEQANL
jgi:hypothetical protein